jgi:hypothetical protein
MGISEACVDPSLLWNTGEKVRVQGIFEDVEIRQDGLAAREIRRRKA